jgi:acyl-coenzyme A thioesterase PaaI-like protein
VVGIAVFSLGRDKFFTSVNLNVDFLRPAKLGEEISVTAKVVRSGSRIIHVAAEMHKGELLLARGQTNLIVTDDNLPQFKA